MLLNQTVQYAFRAMAYLASLEKSTIIKSQDLSKATQIPHHYLSKILRNLVSHQLLNAEKGHGGGFKISKPLSNITFADILRANHFEFEEDKCVFGIGHCGADAPCLLHSRWSKLKNGFITWANQTTLAHVKHDSTKKTIPSQFLKKVK